MDGLINKLPRVHKLFNISYVFCFDIQYDTYILCFSIQYDPLFLNKASFIYQIDCDG